MRQVPQCVEVHTKRALIPVEFWLSRSFDAAAGGRAAKSSRIGTMFTCPAPTSAATTSDIRVFESLLLVVALHFYDRGRRLLRRARARALHVRAAELRGATPLHAAANARAVSKSTL